MTAATRKPAAVSSSMTKSNSRQGAATTPAVTARAGGSSGERQTLSPVGNGASMAHQRRQRVVQRVRLSLMDVSDATKKFFGGNVSRATESGAGVRVAG